MDDIDFNDLYRKLKEYIDNLCSKNSKRTPNEFLDDDWMDFCTSIKIPESFECLEMMDDLGMVEYLGSIGPSDCPDMFNRFRFLL